jgi:glycosyltransferase involved in cell wall biosynthesis
MCPKDAMKGPLAPDLERLRPVDLVAFPENPLVSVLVTNHNYANYIGEAIQSILAQTYSDFEVVICDDGSTDESYDVIETWCRKDARVRLIREFNQGQGAALNTAFSAARGNVIVLLDGDDMALERRLELIVQAFRQHPEAGMVTHALKILDQQGQQSGRDPEEPLDEGWLAPALLQGPEPVFPPTSGLALRAEVARQVFPLPCQLIPAAHWDWVVREGAAFLAPVAALSEVLGVYRLHGHNFFGHSRLSTLEHVEHRLAGLSGAMEGRRIYAQAFLNTKPDPSECDIVLGVLILSRAVLLREQVSFHQISRYSRGKSRWIWSLLFVLPSWLRKPIYLWGRKTQIPLKARRLKGQTVRFLESISKTFGARWKPGRRVR